VTRLTLIESNLPLGSVCGTRIGRKYTIYTVHCQAELAW
jgi:hypothetical protein